MAKLRRELLELVKAKGFTEWTETQEKAIPIALAGKNCLIIAPTGTGKTEAAILPVLSKLLDARDEGRKEGIQALYITPLRALNRDMLGRLEFWCHLLGITLAVRHGDTPQSERARQRDKPAQLFLTTPETLQSMLVAPKLKDSLVNVRFVIVDEVHELIESKRGLQLSVGLQRLKEKSGGFQVIGLSATVGGEEKAARFLAEDAVVVKSGGERELKVSVQCPSKPKKESGEEGEFGGLGLSDETRAKLERVKELIEAHNRTLLFVNTRFIAESLGSLLFESRALAEKIAVHHSSLSKESRVETEQEFKKIGGKLKAIVCTSSLELGIDVGEIDLVIQYVSPRQVTRFIQRIGRSGHRKHLTPKGVLVAGSAFDCFENAVIAQRGKQGFLEPLELRENALDVAGHQAAGLALDYEKISLQQAFDLIRRALPFRSLSLQEFIEVLQQMHLARDLYFDGQNIAASKKTKLYYYENVSTIRDTKKFWVRDAVTRKNVGVLDESFVSEYLAEGATFIARGKAWKVLSVGDKEIAVEQTRDLSAAVPEWVGEEIPISREVAEGVCALVNALCEGGLGEKDLKEKYFCDEEAGRKMIEFAEKQKKFFTPRAGEIVVEANGELIALHSFMGTKANEALARALSFLLSASLGTSVRVKPSAYGALFESSKKIPLARFKAMLEELSGRRLRTILDNALPATSLYRMKFLGVAKAFGVVSKESELSGFGVRRLVEALKDSPVFKEALSEIYFDKLDVEGAARAFDARVTLIEDKGAWSPLAREFFEFGGFSELMVPSEPGSQVVQAFKENLLERHAELYCTFCGKTFKKALKVAEEKTVCPYCASSQVTLEAFKQVWEKKKRRRPLEADEKKRIREANKTIALIAAYGRRALLALETFGVGPETATRVLARLHASEDELLADLLEAQKHFIKTRQFWRL